MSLLSFIKQPFLRNVPEHLRPYCEIYAEVKANDGSGWRSNERRIYGNLSTAKFTRERVLRAVKAIDEQMDEYIRMAAAKADVMESDILSSAKSGTGASDIISMTYRKKDIINGITGATRDRAWMNKCAGVLAEIDAKIDRTCSKLMEITDSEQVADIESELRDLTTQRVKIAGAIISAMRGLECFMCDIDGVKWYM